MNIRRAIVPAVFAAAALFGCGDSVGVGTGHPVLFELVSGDAQTSTVGTPFPEPLVVKVYDKDTLPLQGARVVFRVSAGVASLSEASVFTDMNGLARTTVTPTAHGNIRVTASVFSSILSETFLLSAGGASALACTPENTFTLAAAQVETDIGGPGICLATGPQDTAATYALLAFNTPSSGASFGTADLTLNASGTGIPPVSFSRTTGSILPRMQKSAADRAVEALVPAAQSWWKARARHAVTRTPAALDTVGQLRQFNVNFDDACANPVYRTGRAIRVGTRATLYLDMTIPTPFSGLQLRNISRDFDRYVDPALVLNFMGAADVDTNDNVVLFFTDATNGYPAPFGLTNVLFQRRDLLDTTVCPASNAAEMLYLAVPDAQRTSASLLTNFNREIAHEYQHLINASRRLYVSLAPGFEEPWLDEGLSEVAEELLFYRMAALVSHANLDALDLANTEETREAFDRDFRDNLSQYRQFLGAFSQTSAFSGVDEPARRGAIWSLLRYLVDRRDSADFVSWTQLVGTSSGLANLTSVFGPKTRFHMRDWAIAVLVDDLFGAPPEFRQPSWNFRSIFAALQLPSYTVQMTPLGSTAAVALSVAEGGGAFAGFSVPASSSASITWSAVPPSSAISPMVQWAIVRIR